MKIEKKCWPECFEEILSGRKNFNYMKNKKGYIGLVALLIVVLIAVFWMVYLWRTQWFKSPALNINGVSNENPAENKNVNEQLNDLRTDIKQIQDKKDKEIYDAMENAGKSAENILNQP